MSRSSVVWRVQIANRAVSRMQVPKRCSSATLGRLRAYLSATDHKRVRITRVDVSGEDSEATRAADAAAEADPVAEPAATEVNSSSQEHDTETEEGEIVDQVEEEEGEEGEEEEEEEEEEQEEEAEEE